MNPKVSVLIPTYNRSQYLGECLDSILAQTLPATQVIVINNGSTDNTKELCASYGGKIEYLEMGQLGKSAAINFGLEKVTGDYVWVFDDDDVALVDAIERFVGPLEKNPDCGFSYSASFFTTTNTENGRIGTVMFQRLIPDVTKRGFLIPLLEQCFLSGGTVFARTSCYRKVGGFDPEFLRSQDYEMALRLARHFKAIRATGGPTFHYRQYEVSKGVESANDRLTKATRLKKWLEFDQKIFRKLYKEMSLAEFLAPGESLEKKSRQALLQRMGIMADKLLVPEVIKDLHGLALHNDHGPLTKDEYFIIWYMIDTVPYYKAGSLFDHLEFFKEIRRLCVSSPVIRMLRSKVDRALLARFKNHPGSNKITEIVRRLIILYF